MPTGGTKVRSLKLNGKKKSGRVLRWFGFNKSTSIDSDSDEDLEPQVFGRQASSTTTVSINEMIQRSTLAPEDKKHLDQFLQVVKTTGSPSELLMRCVSAGHVAADWDSPRLATVSDFWATNVGDAVHYWMSMPASRAKRFVTHSWGAPTDWHEVMGDKLFLLGREVHGVGDGSKGPGCPQREMAGCDFLDRQVLHPTVPPSDDRVRGPP